jgi:methylated-DNA-[protein]-cysteine S-methyltransferase
MTSPSSPRLVAQARATTPLGPIRLAATARGLAGLWFDGQAHHPGTLDAADDAAHPALAQTLAELAAYWRGEPVVFGTPLDATGTPFQQRVWQALRAIPRGRTTSYGALAAAIGAPCATRAVAGAVARNPISIVVPCHRVLGRDGSLTGYAGGLERKRRLLALEGALEGALGGAVEGTLVPDRRA